MNKNIIISIIILFVLILTLFSYKNTFYETFTNSLQSIKYKNKVVSYPVAKNILFDFIMPNESCDIKACEYISPEFNTIQRYYFPAKEDFKPYKDIELPKKTNLNCWNYSKDCCKK